MLNNPFYPGHINLDGQFIPGQHDAIIRDYSLNPTADKRYISKLPYCWQVATILAYTV